MDLGSVLWDYNRYFFPLYWAFPEKVLEGKPFGALSACFLLVEGWGPRVSFFAFWLPRFLYSTLGFLMQHCLILSRIFFESISTLGRDISTNLLRQAFSPDVIYFEHIRLLCSNTSILGSPIVYLLLGTVIFSKLLTWCLTIVVLIIFTNVLSFLATSSFDTLLDWGVMEIL